MKKTALLSICLVLFSFIVTGQNAPVGDPPRVDFQEYVSPLTNPTVCSNILIYTDDPAHEPDFVDVALQNLGYSYTAFYGSTGYDWTPFINTLNGGNWDVVIFADDNYTPSAPTYSALLAYVQGGGRLFYHSWQLDVALETALGATVLSSYSGAFSIYRWAPGHPIFNNPNNVPDLTDYTGVIGYSVEGWYAEPILPSYAVAGSTTTAMPNNAGLIIGNNGTTVFQGWMDSNIGDADLDGKNDQVELYENMILGLCQGFIPKPPSTIPLSNWALGIGIFLIVAATLFRVRRYF